MKNNSWILSPLFFAGGGIYEGAVRLRNKLYDLSLLPQQRLPRPVISVGNLTVGGTGKTPFVIHLVHTILRLGLSPALLSRGYGRTAKLPVILPPGAETPFALQTLGDEPSLVRRHEDQIWLGISRKRHATGLEIASRGERLCFILDDGFQHRQLARDLDLVLIDRGQPLAQNRMLPAGTLREPPVGLCRADAAVINGLWNGAGPDPLESVIRRICPEITVFHCEQKIERVVELPDWLARGPEAGAREWPRSALLVAAIGNPQRFRKNLEAHQIEIKGTRFYRDHACLQASDWDDCVRAATDSGAGSIVITEKDAIKIRGKLNCRVLVAVQSTRLVEQAELERRLDIILRDHR